jgi:meso-butanediol dehydrogenase/(S,S)-butanediol dehydrogenase/diacetyl reductase
MQRFDGKTIIVTGSGSGIGQGIAERFAQEGGNVVLAGRTKEKLEQVAQSMDPRRTLVHPCDVTRYGDVEALVAAAIARFGQLDVMVNNAGIAPSGTALELSLEDWHRTLDTNLSGVFYGCRAALPPLLKTKGSIVNTASVSGLAGDWGMTAYNAAKGGVVNLTRALALDHGDQGVRVNSVCPSLTRSNMTQDMLEDEALMARFMARIPLKRHAEPADIAAVVAFLASDDARFINGVNLPVDGGPDGLEWPAEDVMHAAGGSASALSLRVAITVSATSQGLSPARVPPAHRPRSRA